MRRPFLMLILSILAILATAQDVKVDFNDGEFFFAEEDYEEALYAFTQVYNNDYQDNAYVNYRMGVCLIEIEGRKTESIPYLEKASKNISKNVKEGRITETKAPLDALLYLGNAYRINMDIEKAIGSYNEFAQYIDEKDVIMKNYVDQQIVSCGNALVGFNNPVSFTTGNLGQINETNTRKYNMIVSNDLQTMAFMGKNPFYNGVYVATKKDGLWEKPTNITPSIVSDGNMDVVSLSPDGKIMLLAVSDEFTSNIYASKYENDRWNPAESVGKPINSKYYESSATYSPDGKSIYFTSNRKESLGGMDIFRTDLLEDSTWSEPVNLGPGVNTELNEESPFVSPDGKRLYFSSQGHSTIGGFDVFYTELLADGSWNEVPVNLGFPLNTTDDDFAISPTGMDQEGVSYIFAQSKVDGYDVFKFEMIGRDDTPVEVAMHEPTEEELAEEAALAEAAAEAAREPEPAVVVPPERYVLRPIYFDFDSDALSAESKDKLDQLGSLLNKFPGLKLEIEGYTDALGTFEYNQRLSVKRANSVSKYLASTGVDAGRLTVTGMSESDPVARNRTKDNRDAPDGRMLNRRVQFGVSLQEGVIIEMEEVEVPDHLKLDEEPEKKNNTDRVVQSPDQFVIKPVYFDFDSLALSQDSKSKLDA
ncbi:MAG: OmpA family protein [Bacteroidota bacterium]